MLFHRYEAASPSGQPLNTPIVMSPLSPFDDAESEPAPAPAEQAVSPSSATAPRAMVVMRRFFIFCFSFPTGAVNRTIGPATSTAARMRQATGGIASTG